MTLSGEGVAAIILALGTVCGQIGSLVLQIKQANRTKAQGDKLDEVHAATAAIAEQTGTHKALVDVAKSDSG